MAISRTSKHHIQNWHQMERLVIHGNKTKIKHTESFPCSVTVSVFIILSLVSNRVFGVIIVFNDVSAFRIFNFSFDSFLFIFNPPVLCNEIPSVIWSFAFIKKSFGLSNSSLKLHMACNDLGTSLTSVSVSPRMIPRSDYSETTSRFCLGPSG